MQSISMYVTSHQAYGFDLGVSHTDELQLVSRLMPRDAYENGYDVPSNGSI